MIVLLLSWILQFDHVWSHILVGKASISSSLLHPYYSYSDITFPAIHKSQLREDPMISDEIPMVFGVQPIHQPSFLVLRRYPKFPMLRSWTSRLSSCQRPPEPPALNWRLTRVWYWDNWDPLSFCCLEKLLQHKTVFVTYVNLI